MPRVWMDNYLRAQTEVDLPTSCQKCKQDFKEPSSLKQIAFVPYEVLAQLDEEGDIQYAGQSDSLDDGLSVEWRCGQCDSVLVGAAECTLAPGVKMDYVLLVLRRAGIELRTDVLETEAAEEATSD